MHRRVGRKRRGVRLVQAADKIAEVEGQGEWLARQQTLQAVSYFLANGFVVLWVKLHCSLQGRIDYFMTKLEPA
jgi:hypothetical protein